MIIDSSFELDYVDKGSEHTGIDTKNPSYKPFWEVQYLGNGLSYGGTKKECIEWIAEFYYEYYDKKSKNAIYGTTTPEEREELAEEGIDLLSIPWVNKDN